MCDYWGNIVVGNRSEGIAGYFKYVNWLSSVNSRVQHATLGTIRYSSVNSRVQRAT